MPNISQSEFETTCKWLESLGLLTAGAMTSNDAKVRCAAYASLLSDEFPTEAFTRDSLRFVANRCKFFPSFAEVCESLGAWFRENLPSQLRLGSNPAVPGITYALPDLRPPSPEECADIEAKVAALKAEFAAKQGPRAIREVPPKYLSKLDLALSMPRDKAMLRPDLADALRHYDARSQTGFD